MQQIVGYKLVRISDGNVVQFWGGVWGVCPGVPDRVDLPNGDQVHGASVGEVHGDYRLDPWEMDEPPPPPVTAPTQPPTIIETREEVDPAKLRAMVMVMLEEQHEAVAYHDGGDPAQFPLLSKRASQSGVTVAQAAAIVIDEIAAIKR